MMDEQATYNMSIVRGDTFGLIFRFMATDLTGYHILMQWRDVRGAVAVTCDSQATPPTLIITPGVDALVAPILTAAASALLTSSVYSYDIQLTAPSGAVKTPIAGTITVIADVSRLP